MPDPGPRLLDCNNRRERKVGQIRRGSPTAQPATNDRAGGEKIPQSVQTMGRQQGKAGRQAQHVTRFRGAINRKVEIDIKNGKIKKINSVSDI